MTGFPYAARAGDRVLLSATVTRVVARGVQSDVTLPDPGERLVLEVDIDSCCRAHIAPNKVHSVVSQEIRQGDRVTWWGSNHGPEAQGQRMFGTVLFVEPAESVTANTGAPPGEARALVKPDGVSPRPLIKVKDLARVGPEIT